MSLWGGRFAGGPADASPRCRKSTHFDWRLAPYDIAGLARPRPRAAPRRAARRRRRWPRCSTALDAAGGRRRRRAPSCRADDDEDVHTALERGLIERVGRRARRPAARGALPQRPGGHPVPHVPARPRPAPSRPWSSTSSTRSWPRRSAHLGVAMPGRTHLQHAQPVLLAHHLLAHAWAAAARRASGCRTGTTAPRLALRLGRAGRLLAGPGPGGGRRRPRVRRARSRTPSTAPPPATSSPSSRSSPP